ncbi:class I SAM-dependent DNA methyltransferase [Marinospirillum sp.]|uniref:class I SAM-dependent DNA methyltransferase n=1 Tax=Marinospirillum sp. TaxID=2183934 RepID=UPI00384DE977
MSEHFDQSARNWDQRPMSQQLAQVVPRLMEALPLAPSQHLLDFGAGTGMLSVPLAGKVRQVTALDTSEKMLEVLDEKGVGNIKTLQQDVFAGLEDRFEGIVSCMALHHVEDTAALMQVFAEHLQPGGYLGLVDLYKEDGSFHGDNAAKGVKHLGFEPEELKSLMEKAGLESVQFQEILQIQHKNARQYPLFLVTARKP